MGLVRAQRFHRRLSDLFHASSLDDLQHLPGHFHELVGTRKGQWSCDLDQPYRLIFEPIDSAGRPIIVVVEIVDYH